MTNPMPNKKSIESEIANIDFSITVKHHDIPLQEFKITELRLVLKERARKEIKALIQREVKKGRVDPFDFVEPCEPECSKERHAYHKGQWDMATKIRDRLEELEK